jgi:dTDP-4-amino-4,6-dideoxygalactose transaminase
MSELRIPFNRPAVTGAEIDYIQEAIHNGRLSGNGPFTHRAEAMLAEMTGAVRALLTGSCTQALEMAALLLDCAPGDEVIVPAFSFVSTANAFAMHGATPVFADCHRDTLNIDVASVARLISSRTRAIVAMHYGGIACDIEALAGLAASSGAVLIEDNAHGLFGKYRGRPLGSFGTLATQSFHETKNVTCGEGGALLVNDLAFLARAEIIREKGTDRSRFLRGEVDKYTWVDRGSNFLMSELQAAYLCAQLEHADAIQTTRLGLWNRYGAALTHWAAEHNVSLLMPPPECEHPAHNFVLIMPTHDGQRTLIEHLRAAGILAVFHYVPLNTSRMGRAFGGFDGQCPVAESISDRLVRLPMYAALTAAEQDEVITTVLSVPL